MRGKDTVPSSRVDTHGGDQGSVQASEERILELPRRMLDEAMSLPTPFYVFDLRKLQRRATAVVDVVKAWSTTAKVAYPYKANPLPHVTKTLVPIIDLAEVATHHEYMAALDDWETPRRIVVGGAGKPRSLLNQASRGGVTIKVDSIHEVRRLATCIEHGDVHPALEVIIRVALPQADTWSRFGLLPEELQHEELWRSPIADYITGIHFHIGTNVGDPARYRTAAKFSGELIGTLPQGGSVADHVTLNIGGGFPAWPYLSLQKSLERYLAAVSLGLEEANVDPGSVRLVVEPGRLIVEPTGYLIATVVEFQRRAGDLRAVTDAASTLTGGSRSSVGIGRSIVMGPAVAGHEETHCDVFGNLCHEDDRLAWGALLKKGECERDIAIVGDVGAYRFAASASWMQPLPAVYVFDGSEIAQVRGETGWWSTS